MTRRKAVTKLEIVEKYSWYIDRAFDFRKREIEKQVSRARKTLDEEPRGDSPRDEAVYESLKNLADELEWIQREFNQAHEALKAAGVK